MIKELAKIPSVSKKMIDAFTIKILSENSIEAIASKMQSRCDEFGFALLTTYNYHEIVANKGFPINRKVFIYEICQVKTASLMLTTNPNFAVFMPCKISIYEENEKIVISTMDMGLMLSAVKSDESLYKEANLLFDKLKSLMMSLKN